MTDRTGHMGYTFSPFREKLWDALEGGFGEGRANRLADPRARVPVLAKITDHFSLSTTENRLLTQARAKTPSLDLRHCAFPHRSNA